MPYMKKTDITKNNYWLYGFHASKAAINNNKRRILKIAIEYSKKKI